MWVCVVLRVLYPLFLLNIMKHSSPVFSRKKNRSFSVQYNYVLLPPFRNSGHVSYGLKNQQVEQVTKLFATGFLIKCHNFYLCASIHVIYVIQMCVWKLRLKIGFVSKSSGVSLMLVDVG